MMAFLREINCEANVRTCLFLKMTFYVKSITWEKTENLQLQKKFVKLVDNVIHVLMWNM